MTITINYWSGIVEKIEMPRRSTTILHDKWRSQQLYIIDYRNPNLWKACTIYHNVRSYSTSEGKESNE